MCLDFFESRLKRKLRKHWRESWLTSTRYFEVLVVKLTQTSFLNIILRKILRKKSKKRKIFEIFFVVNWVVLCVQNINNWFGAFLWHNNCRKCRNRDTLKPFLFEKNNKIKKILGVKLTKKKILYNIAKKLWFQFLIF